MKINWIGAFVLSCIPNLFRITIGWARRAKNSLILKTNQSNCFYQRILLHFIIFLFWISRKKQCGEKIHRFHYSAHFFCFLLLFTSVCIEVKFSIENGFLLNTMKKHQEFKLKKMLRENQPAIIAKVTQVKNSKRTKWFWWMTLLVQW